MIFQDRKFADKCWTHDLETLVVAAGLKIARDTEVAANQDFRSNWSAVKDWNEIARYQQRTENEARELYEAVTDHTI